MRLPDMPGLDGVRALAVAGVLAYHAGVGWAPGGFLGVDVFFALSGYLITSLLLAEFGRDGRIDLRRFWLGRARRLLPAALAAIALSLLIVAIFLPGELATVRGDAIASVLYVNNWHQILAERSYFASFGRPSPFQHLWSLAVEEQFYLVWPLLLTFALPRLGRRRTVTLTAAIALVSIVLMALVYGGHGDASRVYYGTDTRAFSLLAGALLAYAWPPGLLTRRTGPGAGLALDAVGVAGLGVLVVAMARWQDFDTALYPGGLLAVAGASVALIAAVAHPATRIGTVLGTRPLRWIGRRSYGIYLYHWPVMTFTRPGIDVHANRTVVIVGQVALTVAIAAVSYRYLEMPVRRGQAGRWLRAQLDRRHPRQRLAWVSGTLAVALVALAFPFARGVPAPAHGAGDRPLSTAAAATDPAADGVSPSLQAANGPIAPPAQAARQRPPLAVGASVMLAAQPALQRALGRRARIDAKVGRQPGDIVDRLDDYARADALPDRVVVQIGENGPLWYAELDRLHRILRHVRRVVLVNVRVPRSWESQSNAALREATEDWPQARIADWYGASAGPGLLYDDRTHPTPAGEEAYAAAVKRALR